MIKKNHFLLFGILCFISSCGVAVYMGNNGFSGILSLWCAGLFAIGFSICSTCIPDSKNGSSREH